MIDRPQRDGPTGSGSETTLPAHFEQFRQAVEAGDLDGGVEAARAIARSSPPVPGLLFDLAVAVEDGADERARTLYRSLRTRYAEVLPERRFEVERSTLARQGLEPGDRDEVTLTTTGLYGATVAAARSGVLATAAAFLGAEAAYRTPERRRELANRIRRLQGRERTMAERTEAAVAVTRAVDLPPTVRILAAHPTDRTIATGATTTVGVTVGNVGDARATGLTVRAAAGDVLGGTPVARSIDDLEGGARTTTDLEVRGTSTGNGRLDLRVASGNGGEASTTVRVGVRDGQPLSAAIDTDGDGRIDTEEIQRAVLLWKHNDPVPGTEGRTITTEDLRRLVLTWASDGFV